jgi:hypothetical protein
MEKNEEKLRENETKRWRKKHWQNNKTDGLKKYWAIVWSLIEFGRHIGTFLFIVWGRRTKAMRTEGHTKK